MSENTTRPYVDIHEVKTAISIPEVMQILGIANQFRRRGDTLAGACPLPEHQHGPSPNSDQLKVSQLDDGVWVWHCFGDCQRGGDVIEFVRAMTGHSHAHVRFFSPSTSAIGCGEHVQVLCHQQLHGADLRFVELLSL